MAKVKENLNLERQAMLIRFAKVYCLLCSAKLMKNMDQCIFLLLERGEKNISNLSSSDVKGSGERRKLGFFKK
jgi:hypothetical protein